MSNTPKNFIQRAAYAKTATAGATAATGVSDGIRVFYKGDPAYAAEPGFGYTTGRKATFYLTFTGDGYDTNIASDGGITFSATDTLLTVANKINATKNWGAILVGGLTTDVVGASSANIAAITAAALPAAGAMLLLNTVASADTAPGIASVCIGPESLGLTFGSPASLRSASNIRKFVPDFATDVLKGKGLRRQPLDFTSLLQYVSAYMGTATATAPCIDIYDATQTGETLVRSLAVTASNATATTYNLTDIAQEVLSNPGHRLVVRLQGTGTVTGQTANHYLTASGVVGVLQA